MIKIPISKPYFDQKEINGLLKTVKTGWIMQGPKVSRFEEIFRHYVGSKYAIAVSSGTAALHIALEAQGVGQGDEVITTAFSFIATANSVLHCGARPVFCDIDLRTYAIDPEKIRCFLETKCSWDKKRRFFVNKKTKKHIKAIMPVDQVGLPADLDEITKIADEYGLKVVEDAACALGSKYKKKRIGSVVDVSCFSFHPRKVITTAEGGMITTDNKVLRDLLVSLRSHGQSKCEKFIHKGYNYRMSDLHASMGLAQMKKISAIVLKRRSLAKKYDNAFKDIEMLNTPYVPGYATANYQSYILRLKNKYINQRDAIVKKLVRLGIHAKKGITAIHKEPYYKKLMGSISLPLTELANDSTFLLPLYPSLTDREQDFIIENVKRVSKKSSFLSSPRKRGSKRF